MSLVKYYTLEEVSNRKIVISYLKSLKKEGKINYELDGEIFRLDDLDLDDSEVSFLIDIFEENDVFPYLERDDEDDLYDDGDMYDDEDMYDDY